MFGVAADLWLEVLVHWYLEISTCRYLQDFKPQINSNAKHRGAANICAHGTLAQEDKGAWELNFATHECVGIFTYVFSSMHSIRHRYTSSRTQGPKNYNHHLLLLSELTDLLEERLR